MDRKSSQKIMVGDDQILISPPSGAESLFLGGLGFDAATVAGGAAIFKELQQPDAGEAISISRIRPSGSFHSAHTRVSAVSTDDFVSCVENPSDLDSVDSTDQNNNNNFLLSPLTARSSRFSMETIEDTNHSTSNGNSSNSTTMPSKLKKSIKKVPEPVVVETKPPLPDVAPVVEPPVPPAEEPSTLKVDAAESVYGMAKGIMAWGKSVPIVSFFVGTTEAVAGKALGVVGTDLTEVDGKIESELTKFDTGILTPAVDAIVKILMGVAGKSEATIRPVIEMILKPVGLLLKSEAAESTPEAYTETPEVTK